MPERLYPTYVSWQIDVTSITAIDQLVGHERAHRLQKALNILTRVGYTLRFEDVTADFLDQFIPLYEEHIRTKKNGTISDVRAKLTRRMAEGKKYESISLRQGDQLVGAQLYCLGDETLSVAYRVFPYRLAVKVPISASYLAERYLVERALALGKARIRHGRDRNCYGLHAAIGLAEYKLNIGCVPYVSPAAKNSFHTVDEIVTKQDILVFLGSERRQTITEAILFRRNGGEEKVPSYTSLFVQSAVHVTVEQ